MRVLNSEQKIPGVAMKRFDIFSLSLVFCLSMLSYSAHAQGEMDFAGQGAEPVQPVTAVDPGAPGSSMDEPVDTVETSSDFLNSDGITAVTEDSQEGTAEAAPMNKSNKTQTVTVAPDGTKTVITEEIEKDDQGNQKSRTLSTSVYNSEGTLTHSEMSSFDDKNQFVFKTWDDFNSQGWLMEQGIEYADGSKTVTNYTYDPDGYVIEITKVEVDATGGTNTTTETPKKALSAKELINKQNKSKN